MSTHRPSLNGSIGLGLVFKSISKSFKGQHARGSDHVQINPTVVGGGVDLHVILQRLSSRNPWPMRQAAAERLTKSLDVYVVSSIPELWYLARDMIAPSAPASCRKSALRLLQKCLQLDEYLVGSHTAYWTDIYRNCTQEPVDPFLEIFVDAINILTDHGKNTLEYCRFECNFGDFMLGVLRSIPASHHSLPPLLHLLANSIDNNLVGIGESRVLQILQRFPSLWSQRDQELDNACMRVCQACSSVGFWPPSLANTLLQRTCQEIGTSQNSLAFKVINSLSTWSETNLFSSLCDIMVNEHDVHLQAGAIYALLHVQVWKASRNDFAGECFITLILESIQKALAINLPHLQFVFLECTLQLLSRDSYLETYGVSLLLVSQVLPFPLWYGLVSIYTLLANVTEPDDKSVELIREICIKISRLYSSHEISTPLDSLLELILRNALSIDPETASFVLDHYYAEKKCTMLDPSRSHNIAALMRCFFVGKPAQIQRLCVSALHRMLEFDFSAFPAARVDASHTLDLIQYLVCGVDAQVARQIVDMLFATVGAKSSPETYSTISEMLQLLVNAPPTCDNYFDHLVVIAERAATMLFTFTATNKQAKTLTLYDLLLSVARCALTNNLHAPLLTVCKCLIRLRCTQTHRVYFTQPADMIGLADTFKRHLPEGDQDALWVYPEMPAFIPPRSLDVLSSNVKSVGTSPEFLDISPWFAIVLDIMDSFVHWEVYTYILAHFCAQLLNLVLFEGCNAYIARLRAIICGQLALRLPPALVVAIPPNMHKANVQAALVRNLLALMGYLHNFSKQDTDEIVNALISGLSAWDKTGVPCINILTVCCYAMPLSIKKYLLLILAKLQAKISSAYTIAHTLEFLLALYRVPTLTLNFTADEYKRVIAILFKFIQFSTEKHPYAAGSAVVQAHGTDATVEESPSTADTMPFLPELRRYTICLAYSVMINWFLKIGVADRISLAPFMKLGVDQLARQSQEDPVLAGARRTSILDFIDRFSFLDAPISFRHKFRSGAYQHWLMGTLVVSVAEDGRSIVARRPTGSTEVSVSCYADNAETLLHVLYNTLSVTDAPLVRLTSDDEGLVRGVNVLDRTPAAELHKIGVVYIGPGQTTENQVLGNTGGLAEYIAFLEGLGQLLRLRGTLDVYLGGLDHEHDSDGQYTRHWQDQITQVVFHVATMMSPQVQITMKKRHIGNDYTNIYFDESGEPFNFNLLRLQFTFLSIVISPHTRADERIVPVHPPNPVLYYKVKTYRRSGVPAVFATCHYKLVEREQLSQYVRDLAITANTLALSWHASNDVFSLVGWLTRAQQIERIRERVTCTPATADKDTT